MRPLARRNEFLGGQYFICFDRLVGKASLIGQDISDDAFAASRRCCATQGDEGSLNSEMVAKMIENRVVAGIHQLPFRSNFLTAID
jgi:hypothetical protein